MENDLSLLCTICDTRIEDSTDWIELPEGDIACETCQLDACASVGQMKDNIRHMRRYPEMIARWLEE